MERTPSASPPPSSLTFETFESVIDAFTDDVDFYICSHNLKHDFIMREYAASVIEDMKADSGTGLVSSLAKAEQKCKEYVLARLVELHQPSGLDEVAKLVQDEVLTTDIDEWDDKEFWQSVWDKEHRDGQRMLGFGFDRVADFSLRHGIQSRPAEVKSRRLSEEYPVSIQAGQEQYSWITHSRRPLSWSQPGPDPEQSQFSSTILTTNHPNLRGNLRESTSAQYSHLEKFHPLATEPEDASISSRPRQGQTQTKTPNPFRLSGTVLKVLYTLIYYTFNVFLAIICILVACWVFICLLEEIPFVGPISSLLIRALSTSFSSWLSSLFEPARTTPTLFKIKRLVASVYSFATSTFLVRTPGSARNDLGPPHIPLDAPIAAAYQNSMNLSMIAIEMLSCAKLLDYSELSLQGASAIVRASQIYGRDEIASNYKDLKAATGTLGLLLHKYDVGVEAQISTLEKLLGMAHVKLLELIRESTNFKPSPLFTLISSISLPLTLGCVALPFFISLPPSIIAGCTASVITSSQGACYFHAFNTQSTSFLDKAPLICSPMARLGIGRLSDFNRMILQQKGDALARDFFGVANFADYHNYQIRQISEDGKRSALEIKRLYNEINVLRFEGVNKVNFEVRFLSSMSEHTPRFLERLVGVKTRGLTHQEIHHSVRLSEQLRSFSELESAHQKAYAYFSAAEFLLTNMDVAVQDLATAIEQFNTHATEPRNWVRIAAEAERLAPLVTYLKELSNFHREKRRQVVRVWKARQEECMRTRRDWPVCVAEGGF